MARFVAAGLSAAALTACGGGGPGPAHGGDGEVERVRAPAPGVSHYRTTAEGDAVRGPSEPKAAVQRGVDAAAEEAGQSLAGDDRLGLLAEWIGERLGAGGAPPPHEVVEFFARHLGLVEPVPHLLVLGQPDPLALERGVADAVRRFLARQPYNRYGAAVVERGGLNVAVVVLSTRFVELEPIPRRLDVGAEVRLSGRLLGAFARPQLAIARPSGDVERLALGAGPALAQSVPMAERGAHRVEILAQGPRGDTVVANFPVWVGEDPPEEVVLERGGEDVDASGSVEEVHRALLRRINDTRVRRGLQPVVEHPGLDEVALAHSEDMLENEFVGHTSPTTGDAPDRVREAGYRSGLILENIGRGYSANEIHEGLMGSPGHRANILNRDVTHVGIGVVGEPEGSRQAFLATQVFIRMNRQIDLAAARERLLRKINEGREARGAEPLEADENLEGAASEAATSYFAIPEQSQQDTVDEASSGLRRFSMMFSRVGGLMAVVGDVDEAARLEPTFDPEVRYVGIGLAQGDRPDAPPNSIAVVIMLGWAR
ncbi:MAG TPA: CAP domain-containing protein [Polyangiaceae bacterium LLY-WYZ-15_(1-7)]|nr:hypothetical protein [Sandaracinus sp.]HJL04519.1 CAP domain-containing protein [Polyangiaceae bacterium LLY-WYZ-15_(1-7)]MBJ72103.1 hypothetical protein [Sandaracinus sp.]HJL08519.1 CAP domain-containing protein [Polyangiaceae bacterium LLY-WYZ-15_(1-7)]HJL22830.1 CAP domain-containing protein [Polyangiaceae bacterium LLY-WYZ-15_(1-7)]